MLGHRLRRWPNIKPTLFQYVVFDGLSARPDQTLVLNCFLYLSVLYRQFTVRLHCRDISDLERYEVTHTYCDVRLAVVNSVADIIRSF